MNSIHPGDPQSRVLPSYDELFERQEHRQRILELAEPQVRFRWRLSLFLFLATCASTYGVQGYLSGSWAHGAVYAATLMTILTAHEFGHYLQARRYGVPASLPYFIPMPISLFGTLGAVILMRPRKAGPKALFDIAATGPVAGLIPALLASYFGLRWSQLITVDPTPGIPRLGEPLILRFFSHLVFGTLPEGQEVLLHPVAFAGWVGLFITALNLLPIGQLDGGHILYTLVGKKAHLISVFFLGSAALLVAVDILFEVVGPGGGGYWPWGLLVILLYFLGAKHPPTADDGTPLDRGRALLGWCLLLFVIVGFTPRPLIL